MPKEKNVCATVSPTDWEKNLPQIAINGPFTETKMLIAGYWLWQVNSMKEASPGSNAAPTQCQEILRWRIFYPRTSIVGRTHPSGDKKTEAYVMKAFPHYEVVLTYQVRDGFRWRRYITPSSIPPTPINSHSSGSGTAETSPNPLGCGNC
jgi:hypothetical protein